MAPDLTDKLLQIREFVENKQWEKAWPAITELMYEDPNDPRILTEACSILDKQGNSPLSYQIARRICDMAPKNVTAWINLGKVADSLWRYDESANAYQRALTLVKPGDDYNKASIYNNLAALQVQNGRYKEAKTNSERALKLEPEFRKARHNLGIAQLALKEWDKGWDNYEFSLGSDHRALFKYNDEPMWKGDPGKTVVIFGEQGLGDEICSASMVPDAIERAGKVIIDCDSRLENLLQRSFPKAKVYGTRTKKVLNWDEQDQQIDYSIANTQLGGIFRTSQDTFHGKPFLVPDPERVHMWKALWATKKKPVLGIAWTGGVRDTGKKYRIWTPEQIQEIIGSVDAHWVSLQYKDHDPVPGIHQYKHATLTQDYDDTAALVASLDGVVAMQSTGVHIAGALGIPCAAGVPVQSQWRYGEDGEMPWYSSVTVFRQKTSKWDLHGIKQWLRQFQSSSATTLKSQSPITFAANPSFHGQASQSLFIHSISDSYVDTTNNTRTALTPSSIADS